MPNLASARLAWLKGEEFVTLRYYNVYLKTTIIVNKRYYIIYYTEVDTSYNNSRRALQWLLMAHYNSFKVCVTIILKCALG